MKTSGKETARLQKELKNTRLERDILKEGAALLRWPRREIYLFIRENVGRLPNGKMCGGICDQSQLLLQMAALAAQQPGITADFYCHGNFKDLSVERR
jgi:hypothetical protein